VRPSNALPYELYTHGGLNAGANSFALSLQAGKNAFGSKSVGVPYTVTAPGKYNEKGNTDIGRKLVICRCSRRCPYLRMAAECL